MAGDPTSSRTLAVVGTGPEGVAAMINTIVRVAYDTPDGAPPVKIWVFDDKSLKRVRPDAPYPHDSNFLVAHAFDADDPPAGFPTFAAFLVDRAKDDPGSAEALMAPKWKDAHQYLQYLLELAVLSFGAQVELEVSKTPIREIRETGPRGAASLLLNDGTRLDVDRLVRAGPLRHMASPDTARGALSGEEVIVARLKLRDWSIISAGAFHFWNDEGTKAFPLWEQMADRRPAVGDVDEARDLVQAPWLVVELGASQSEWTAKFNDPPTIGEAIPYADLLAQRAEYFALCSSNEVVAGLSRQERTFRVLLSLIRHIRKQEGFAYARDVVVHLHEHRWIPGTWAAGCLLVEAAGGFGSPLQNRAKNPAWFSTRIEEVMALIQKAKDEVRTLTEWSEALYRLSPQVRELMFHLDVTTTNEAAQWRDYFAGVIDDISDVRLRNTYAARRGLGDASAETWSRKYLTELRRGRTVEDFRRELRKLYQDHVTLPKFWQDAAWNLHETADESIPEILDDIDPLRAVSIDVLEYWSSQWQDILDPFDLGWDQSRDPAS